MSQSTSVSPTKYHKYIKEGFFAWTLTSNGYKYMTLNAVLLWRKAVQNVPLCVFCSDKASYQFLYREGVNCVLIDGLLQDYGPQIVPFGSKQFSNLNILKLKLLSTFAEDKEIQQCLYLDGDIAIYKDIVADIKERLKEGPLLMPCDEKTPTCISETSRVACPNVCSGLIAWNHGADGGIFKITEKEVWNAKPEDQVWVNYAIEKLKIPVIVLSRTLYPNGARASLTKNTPELANQAICLHYNYRVGNSKKEDMKRFGDWILPY